jgi:CDP-diglyceride synthetase
MIDDKQRPIDGPLRSFASPSRTWAGAVLGCFAGALMISMSFFSLTECNERCLTTPKLRLWDAAE